MANLIGSSGIQIDTYQEILTAIIEGSPGIPGLKQIYGADINVGSNTPDGQMINIFALSKQDVLDLLVQIYNSKDPDQAIGVDLDSVSQLCGISRKGGTYTEVTIAVVATVGLNLDGIDGDNPFTVSDGAENQFLLKESATLVAGTNNLTFRAEELGFIQVLPNTITTIVTTTAGITSVNNPSAPSQVGTDQETDADFRVRRAKSVALPAKGVLDGLFGGLNQIADIISARVYENNTDVTDADDIPPHSIWVVVDGGSDEDVAATIYKYRSAGCGMKGDEVVQVIQLDTHPIDIKFDRVVEEELSIYFHADSISGGIIDSDFIKSELVARYTLGIFEPADTSAITCLVREINPDVVTFQEGVSIDRISYFNVIYPSDKHHKFVLSTENISILTDTESSSSSSSSRSSSSSSRSSSSSSRSSSSSSRSSSSSSSSSQSVSSSSSSSSSQSVSSSSSSSSSNSSSSSSSISSSSSSSSSLSSSSSSNSSSSSSSSSNSSSSSSSSSNSSSSSSSSSSLSSSSSSSSSVSSSSSSSSSLSSSSSSSSSNSSSSSSSSSSA